MDWHLILIAVFVVLVALFLTALFLYSNLRRQHNSTGTMIKLGSNREEDRPVRREDCRG
jgi:hypothetical protein